MKDWPSGVAVGHTMKGEPRVLLVLSEIQSCAITRPLTSAEARAVAAELVRRAELLDRSGEGRVVNPG